MEINQPEIESENKILLVFYKNNERHAGMIDESVYYSKLFDIFVKHLKPLSEEELYNFKVLMKEVKLPEPKQKTFIERIFKCQNKS